MTLPIRRHRPATIGSGRPAGPPAESTGATPERSALVSSSPEAADDVPFRPDALPSREPAGAPAIIGDYARFGAGGLVKRGLQVFRIAASRPAKITATLKMQREEER